MKSNLITQAKKMLDKYGKTSITVTIFEGMFFARVFKNFDKADEGFNIEIN